MSEFDSRLQLGIEALIGRAFVDAYEEESSQQWSGAVVLEDAWHRYSDQLKSSGSGDRPEFFSSVAFLIRYPVPRRSASGDQHESPEALAVAWPNALFDYLDSRRVAAAFAAHGKSVEEQSVRNKIANTVAFVEHVGGLDKSKIRPLGGF